MLKAFVTLLLAFPLLAETVQVPYQNIFLPLGYDENDTVEVVVTGMLPDLCYRSLRIEKKVDEQKKTIHLELLADYTTNRPCVEVLFPFQQVVRLGGLKKGVYEVFINGLVNGEFPEIAIEEEVGDTKDDHYYLKVTDVDLKGNIIVTGQLMVSCLELDRIEHRFNGVDTLSILPILKRNEKECKRTDSEVTYEIPLPKGYSYPHEVLFHVRSMAGQSVNKIFIL